MAYTRLLFSRQVNRKIFFTSTRVNPIAVFIAWFNLDLGIQTCSCDGMDAYEKPG